MNQEMRQPTMQYSLQTLIKYGVDINTVIDVGVLTITQPLVEVFPDKFHHLFEPVDTHFEKIRHNYRNIDYELHHVALSDEDGEMFLACTSITNDGVVTHSHVIDSEVTKDEMPSLVSCKKIRQAKLDTVISEADIKPPYLLKVDVDGHELNILRGADKTLEDTAIVVIEAPLDRGSLPKFFERALYLLEKGFCLMDIVDLSYYDDVLWQVDLVFVRKDLVDKIDQLRPFQSDTFSFEGAKWYALNKQKFMQR